MRWRTNDLYTHCIQYFSGFYVQNTVLNKKPNTVLVKNKFRYTLNSNQLIPNNLNAMYCFDIKRIKPGSFILLHVDFFWFETLPTYLLNAQLTYPVHFKLHVVTFAEKLNNWAAGREFGLGKLSFIWRVVCIMYNNSQEKCKEFTSIFVEVQALTFKLVKVEMFKYLELDTYTEYRELSYATNIR